MKMEKKEGKPKFERLEERKRNRDKKKREFAILNADLGENN